MRIVTAALTAAAISFAANAQGMGEDVKSPACDLLTMEEASAAFGAEAARAGAAEETMGNSSCGWMDTKTYNTISFGLVRGEGLGGNADAAYDAMKSGMAMMGATEDLSGVGEKAFISKMNNVPTESYSIGLIQNGALLSINTSGVGRDAAVTVATEAAGRM